MAVVLTFLKSATASFAGTHGRPVRQAALVQRREGGVELPSYRDNVNGSSSRRKRMVQANQSAATLKFLSRAFAQGGYADLVNR